MKCLPAILLAGLLFQSTDLTAAESPLRPGPVPDEVRAKFKLSPFYEKFVDVGGLPIVGSTQVSDNALAECAWIVSHMLERRPDILQALAKGNVRFAIMAYTEYTTDIPEHSRLKPAVYWDRRARGLGATPDSPAVSGGEENLLAFPGDPYPTENIPIHEFGHAIHEVGMAAVDPTFDGRLKQAYDDARARGLWKETYAAVNRMEYWAEAVQSWFDNNRDRDALHNGVNTRVKLREYDPGVAALCEEVFGDIPWRYQKPANRSEDGRTHLKAYDPKTAPRFEWRKVSVPDQPRVTVQFAEGELELEFDPMFDPARMGDFLDQVQAGVYSGGNISITKALLRFSPAKVFPTGEVVPSDIEPWSISLEKEAAEKRSFRARVKKGESLLESLSGKEIALQRVVRLN